MHKNLPIRKNIRLKGYDYSKENIYFITICAKERKEILGKITERNDIELTKESKIAKYNINEIEKIYDNAIIDEYTIMPNHIHILVKMKNKKNVTISKVIKHYKAKISREITYSIWQKSFYEHIVRNETEYIKIKEYIQNNVANWKEDKYY